MHVQFDIVSQLLRQPIADTSEGMWDIYSPSKRNGSHCNTALLREGIAEGSGHSAGSTRLAEMTDQRTNATSQASAGSKVTIRVIWSLHPILYLALDWNHLAGAELRSLVCSVISAKRSASRLNAHSLIF